MTIDRTIALVFLGISISYGYAAFDYPLLPFERNMPFLPNTFPKVLAVIAALLSVALLLQPNKATDKNEDNGEHSELTGMALLRTYKLGQAAGLLVAMVAFALALRPLGFIAATTAFLVGSGLVLGERNFKLMVPISIVGAFGIWYLVQEMLGIFLRPWPWFL